MQTLITGGAGFIGSHVVRELVKLGSHVVVLDDLSGGFRENLPNETELVVGSITDAECVDRVFALHRFDYVYHLAAYAAEGLSHFIRRFNYTNNVVGTMNLINAAVNSNVRCFVFTSSIAVYGSNTTPMSEEMVPQPEDPYGIAKLAVEQDLAAAHRIFGLPYVIFRPHNVYGEYQNIGDRYRNVVGIFMNQVMLGIPMTVFGTGEQRRAFSYVGDVAPVIAQAPFIKNAQCQVFNIGADAPYTVNKLAREVASAMGVTPEIEYLPPRDEVIDAYSDHSKLQNVFKFQARTSLGEGLARMASWARKVGPRRTLSRMSTEVSRGVPASWASEN